MKKDEPRKDQSYRVRLPGFITDKEVGLGGNTDVTEKFFVRVDVTEEFPFLVTKMSPYYDR
jgi:hypothetical protein